MGIDPGLTRLGYGVVEESKGRLWQVSMGTLVTPAGGGTAERLLSLFRRISDLIAEHRPEAVSVERIFFNLNAKTAVPVIQASGAALVAAAESGADVHEYTPLEVKNAVVGTGGATKDQIRYMVGKLLHLSSPESADEADALALAICHLHSRRLKALEEVTR